MKSYVPIVIFLTFLPLFSCKTPVQEIEERNIDPLKEQFVNANQYMEVRHQDQISAFVDRAGWKMQKTTTGLWIMLTEEGKGRRVTQGEKLNVFYTVRLLDGTLCYTSGKDKPGEIILGKGQLEAGVEQGLLMMRHGDHAIMLIPPHLAHGNFGDRNKIPGASVIIYDIVIE